jgi:hypothetical protein
MKDSPMTVYRLQNFEVSPAPAQSGAAGIQLPPQIQQWIQAGASLLPPGLLAPGLIPGSAPTSPPANSPRFHGFRVLDYQQVTDPSTQGEVLDTLGHKANFQSPTSSCMYAELGFAIGRSNSLPADILVSLSCQTVQSFNFAWPYEQTGLTPDSDKKFATIVQRVFGGR